MISISKLNSPISPKSQPSVAGAELDATDLLILDQLQHDADLTNQALAERVFTSPPTCLRRVKRLKDLGLIERQIAILSPDKLAPLIGHGLTAIVEITLERQDALALDAFESRVSADTGVQQCYRVSPGPDFVLITLASDMPGYLAMAQRLFTADANVRNVKAFFSLKRSKFAPQLPLPAAAPHTASRVVSFTSSITA